MDDRARNRWLAAGALLAAFVAGGLGGAAATMLLRETDDGARVRVAIPRMPDGLPGTKIEERVIRIGPHEALARRLDLSAEQSRQVDRILEDQREKADRLMGQMEPRLRALMDSTNAAIEEVLTPEQREEFARSRLERRRILVRELERPAPPPDAPAPPPEAP